MERLIATYLATIPVSYFVLVFIHFDKEKQEIPLARKQQIRHMLLYQLVMLLLCILFRLKK